MKSGSRTFPAHIERVGAAVRSPSHPLSISLDQRASLLDAGLAGCVEMVTRPVVVITAGVVILHVEGKVVE
jgi:hypothetical protein